MRSSHRGVVLLRPDPKNRIGWRARYRDPDSGKLVKVTLDPVALSTAEARTAWAKAKSSAISKRKMELESGAPRATGGLLTDVIDRYFKAHPRLRPRTRTIYRTAADKLLAWAARHGLESADDLNRAKLLAFREELVRERKHRAKKGGGRGAYVRTTETRSPVTVNQELRAARTVLGYLGDLDLLPRLTHDDLRRALKRLPVTQENIDYLKPHEVKALLEAALRHDADTFAETREEHAGERPKGTTLRYEPIAPFVWAMLATGMRIGEAIGLDWSEVDLHALDHDGREGGAIRLGGARTKTKGARTVWLEVSPALHKMLSAMKLASGGKGSVFALSRHEAESAAARLKEMYGAPEAFTWQALRRTCGTYLTNSPGVFGAASAYRSAKQLGHSVQVAEKHYVDVARGIPREARTLEDAMQVRDVVAKVVARVGAGDRAAGEGERATGEGASVVVMPIKRAARQ